MSIVSPSRPVAIPEEFTRQHAWVEWYASFLKIHQRRTHRPFAGQASAVLKYFDCGYLPETAVYEVTGIDHSDEPTAERWDGLS